jgi:predicted TIM-barrel fold metal-dependent hydrolase
MYYNCHIHIFTDKDVPNRFLPLALVPILRSTAGYKVLSTIMRNLIFWKDDDVLDRYVRFVRTGRYNTQKQIFERCLPFYPDGTRFVVLPMDMAFMGAGKVPRDYKEQLEELFQLKKEYPDTLIPFVHVDPRRNNTMDLLKKCVEEYGFKGVKLYPPLGVFPYDARFDPVYSYCETMNLPILTHCSPFNPVHYKGSRQELLKLLQASKKTIDTKGKKNKELCSNFTHPLNYIDVVERFPKLRICFGHFGSQYYWDKYIHHPEQEDNWVRIIRHLCINYPNFYTDVSFTMADTKYFSLLKVFMTDDALNRKILFGSDYYMVEVESNERRFGLDLRAFLGEENFHKISVTNPEAFLGWQA